MSLYNKFYKPELSGGKQVIDLEDKCQTVIMKVIRILFLKILFCNTYL